MFIDDEGEFLGTLIGAVVGAVIGLVSAVVTGDDIVASVAGGAVSGAINGLAGDIAMFAGGWTVTAAIIGGGVGGAAGEAVYQYVKHGEIVDENRIWTSTAIGVAGGYLGGVASKAASDSLKEASNQAFKYSRWMIRNGYDVNLAVSVMDTTVNGIYNQANGAFVGSVVYNGYCQSVGTWALALYDLRSENQ